MIADKWMISPEHITDSYCWRLAMAGGALSHAYKLGGKGKGGGWDTVGDFG